MLCTILTRTFYLGRVFFILLVLSHQTLADTEYRLVPSSSKIGFSIRHLTGRAQGVFSNASGTLSFSKDRPADSRVAVSVEVASIDTKSAKRDEHLRTEEYFWVEKFPKMTFKSLSFRKVAENSYMVTGPLVIRGHSKDISVPMTLRKAGSTWATGEDTLQFQGDFVLDRTEFGVGTAGSLLGNEVTLNLFFEFRALKAK